jgi:response regulator of citrate/malate metabolism
VIRTLVVDDDFRVAHVHAASVDRVDGFTCVGQAHSSAQARAVIAELRPDLLILDIYLPDEDGISLFRSLLAGDEPPDCFFVTAARDLKSVQAAMRLGAAYYLVKPFGFDQFRDKLLAYRRWREGSGRSLGGGQADQAQIDALYRMRHQTLSAPARSAPLHPTMAKVLAAVREAPGPVTAAGVAETLRLSRPTAQRYLSDLQERGLIRMDLEYGVPGRPTHRYRPV